MNALYRGGLALLDLYHEYMDVRRERRLELKQARSPGSDLYRDPTCEMVPMVTEAATAEFDALGCSWGMERELLMARVLDLLQHVVMRGNDCDIFDGVIDLRVSGLEIDLRSRR